MEPIKDFFDLTRNEQRGALSLLIIICLLIIARIWVLHIKEQNGVVEIKAHRERLESSIAPDKDRTSNSTQYKSNSGRPKASSKLHKFDPNTVPESELRDLGFKEWQIKNVMNFRKAGGKFRVPADLKKLYSIKPHDFEKYYPYVAIFPVQPISSLSGQQSSFRNNASLVELNTADSIELRKLKGVGAYYAKKIVERRERLGGFYKPEQLLEVYRIDPSVVEDNIGTLSVDPSKIRKLSLNSATVSQLGSHPYIGYRAARIIVNYREQHGRFTAIKEISNSVLITDSLYSKIAPYLSVDD